MLSRPAVLLLAFVLTIAAPRPALAWGFEVHKYIMARAIRLLPPEIRPFFERYETTIVEHAIDPDLWRTAGWKEEPPRHFLDLDAYGAYPFSDLPRDYGQAVKRHGRDFIEKNGLLPWRTAEMHAKLVEAFGERSAYGPDNIKFFSSVLTHYVSDAHVPFHAVLNYDGQLTGQRGIHSRFETELFLRFRRELRIPPKAVPAVGSARDFTFDTLLASFPLAARVLEADKAAAAGREFYDDQYFSAFFAGVQPILEGRLADSIAASAAMIAAAWIEAGRPAVPLERARAPRRVRQ